jgi:large subunit ribosomal protein L15
MELESLPKLNRVKGKRRVGRGHGSGMGKTSGRGTKGQKARENVRLGFVGGASTTRFIKRLPFRRGVGNIAGSNDLTVNISDLASFPEGSQINVETLVQAGLISFGEAKRRSVKILGNGELEVGLKVELSVTKQAAEKITKAGGEVLSKKL